MANLVVLNNETHHKLKVDLAKANSLGANVNQFLIFPNEIEDVQREYPILFRKDENGQFVCVAISGLERDTNLFLKDDHWQSRYVPAIQSRGPFSIGIQKNADMDENAGSEPIIHIDLDHPAVNEKNGHAVFLEHGGHSPYLEYISGVLRTVFTGLSLAPDMFAAFSSANILEEMTLEVKISETEQIDFLDYYTISREKLLALSGDALSGLLRPCITWEF